MPDVGPHSDDCPRCVASSGLCDRHQVGVLPLLARNVGWLKLMGEARVEQKRRQSREDAATKKAKRRNARRDERGYLGLARAIVAA
jgi:hypothetical protein